MSAMKEVVEKHFLHMEIIVNPKVRFPVPYLGILADCSLFCRSHDQPSTRLCLEEIGNFHKFC